MARFPVRCRRYRDTRRKLVTNFRRVSRYLRHRTGKRAMNAADCYHTGLVVADMDAAAQRLTAAMGYRWTKPVEATLSVTTAEGDVEVPFAFVYSVNAPHLELIRQVPGTIWTV